jgi:hypothetical protein
MTAPGEAQPADVGASTEQIPEPAIEAAAPSAPAVRTSVAAAPAETSRPTRTPQATPTPSPPTRAVAPIRPRAASVSAPPTAPDLATRIRTAVRRIGVARVLCWQIALLAALATIGEPRPVVIAIVAGAIAAVAATTIRMHGHWLYEWIFRAAKFTLRPRQRKIEPGRVLDVFARHTRVETVELDDVPVALIHHPGGIAAILEPQSQPDEFTSPAALLPPPDVNTPPFAAQMIMQLTGKTPRTWITVQAVRSRDIYRDSDLTAALTNTVHRLTRRLTREEVPTRALDRDEALTLIGALAQLDDVAAPCRETWDAWETGTTVQACFQLTKWQEAPEHIRQLILRHLRLLPSLNTAIAIAARQTARGEPRTNVIVRITEADRTLLNNSADLLTFALDGSGIVLDRLDGDHLAAVAASLPLGGALGRVC